MDSTEEEKSVEKDETALMTLVTKSQKTKKLNRLHQIESAFKKEDDSNIDEKEKAKRQEFLSKIKE